MGQQLKHSRQREPKGSHIYGGYMIELPVRRYAIFSDNIRGKYAIVVKGERDIETAPRWGGFVSWLGGVKESTTRGKK